MESILESKQQFIQNGQKIFAARNINLSNIIKTESGDLALIDWEKCGFANNPAADYGFIFTSLWSNPDLQDRLLLKACEANKNHPNFREKFRIDFIFN